MRKNSVLFFALIGMVFFASTLAFANEEKSCHADSDCAHGEHCKDGHCHK